MSSGLSLIAARQTIEKILAEGLLAEGEEAASGAGPQPAVPGPANPDECDAVLGESRVELIGTLPTAADRCFKRDDLAHRKAARPYLGRDQPISLVQGV